MPDKAALRRHIRGLWVRKGADAVFGRKAKSGPPRLRLTAAGGDTIFDDVLINLVLTEPVILRLSTEFFQDPEPCHIHRGAVLSRVFLELQQALEGQDELPVSALPESMHAYLDAYPSASYIRMTAAGRQ